MPRWVRRWRHGGVRPSASLGRAAHRRDGVVAGRTGGILFTMAGALALVTVPFVGAAETGRLVAVLALFTAISVALIALPWGRLPPLAPIAIPIIGHAYFRIGEWLVPGITGQFAPFLMLPYVYAGLFLRQGTCLALAPLTALVVWTMPSSRDVDVALVVAVGVLTGELLAHVARRDRRSRQRLDAVLHATRELVAATETADAAHTLRDHTARLLHGDVIRVHLTAWDTDLDADRQATTAIHPSTGVGKVMSSGASLFVADARTSPLVSPDLVHQERCRSVLFVPLVGARAPIGALVIGWRRPRRRMNQLDHEVLELLAADAGRVLERIARTEEMESRSLTDALCGIGNRRRWEERIGRLEPGDAVVIVDVDHFKAVNDTRGHPYGDAVLQALAAVLAAAARSGDDVCRIGGDEFGVVLAGSGPEGARRYLDRVTTLWEGTGETTGFSSGQAVVADDADAADADETIRAADQALYRAKSARGPGRARSANDALDRPGSPRQ